MRYLVTGAQGFLGAQIVAALRSLDATVIATGRRRAENVMNCDLTIEREVFKLIKEASPDCIVHCAAYVPKTLEDYNNSNAAQTNLQMLDSILAASTCPIIYISSMTVYGGELNRPVLEKDAGHPTSAYGNSKWLGEQLLIKRRRSALALRIPGLFGPTRPNGLVYNVIHSAKFGKMPNLPSVPILWAAMHIEDATLSIVKLVQSKICGFEAINIGYRGLYSINTLVNLANNLYGRQIIYNMKHPSFEFDLTRAELRAVVPDLGLREALIKFGSQI